MADFQLLLFFTCLVHFGSGYITIKENRSILVMLKTNSSTLNDLPYILTALRRSKRAITQDFPVCPSKYPYARDKGRKCCDYTGSDIDRMRKSTCFSGTYVSCGHNVCEDYESPCVEYYGDKIYAYSFENNEYNGKYTPQILAHNRPVYVKGNKCIWWHQKFRHWWMGPCEYVGDNQGYAYQSDDLSCPVISNHSDLGKWRRGGSNALLKGVTNYPASEFSGTTVEKFSATGGTNSRIFRGRYRQVCKWKFSNGRFRCLKDD